MLLVLLSEYKQNIARSAHFSLALLPTALIPLESILSQEPALIFSHKICHFSLLYSQPLVAPHLP